MTKELIIIALVILIIYLYYQNRKLAQIKKNSLIPFIPVTADNSTSLIFELDERSLSAFDKDQEELIAERDQAIRSKNEAEAELLSINNRLKNKQQEVTKKETEIERLKKEKSSSEMALNSKLKEWKEKYSKQGKLLDEEQLENNKLSEKVEQLEQEIKSLKEQKKWEEEPD